jgi:hypothetical protein
MDKPIQSKLPVESREVQLERLQKLTYAITILEEENETDRARIRARTESIKSTKEQVKELSEELEFSANVTLEEIHGEAG